MFLVPGFLFLVAAQAPQADTSLQKPDTSVGPASYDAIATGGDSRLQIEAIEAALAEYLAGEVQGRPRKAFLIKTRGASRAETAFSFGPIATVPRPAPAALTAALVAASQDDDRRVRREALYALGSIGPPLTRDQAGTLTALVQHEDAATRAAAAAVVGRLRVASAADALVNAINDRDPGVKAAAMRALGDLRYERAVQGLNDQLGYYKRGGLALAALEGLAGIGHASSVPLFEAALADREAAARRLAAEGLARSGHAAAAPLLGEAFAREKEPFARLAMAFALSRLGQPYQHRLVEGLREPRTAPQAFSYLIELAPASRRTLEPLLADPDERLRSLASRALERIAGPSAGKKP